MNDPSPRRSTIGGGFLVALGTIVGAFAGANVGQPSLGLLIGLGVGAALALAIWWRDRAR